MRAQRSQQLLCSTADAFPPQKAKKKPIDVVKPHDLGVDVAPRIDVLEVVDPPTRKVRFCFHRKPSSVKRGRTRRAEQGGRHC